VRKGGILNAQLAGALARLGHTDLVVVCDCGLPVPDGPEVVDLAFRFGTLSFEEVLRGLLGELVVERATAALEVREANPGCYRLLKSELGGLDLIPHEQLKLLVREAKLVVRTGEARPYANVILRCGVPF
jgi:D-ribose pyranase